MAVLVGRIHVGCSGRESSQFASGRAPTTDACAHFPFGKQNVFSQVLTVRTERYQIVSCPVHITGDRYLRNYLLFNVALVFAVDVAVAPFEPVVRKLASVLRSLEIEIGYIVGDGKHQLEAVLHSVRDELNRAGRADVPINVANTLRLQVAAQHEECPLVELHEVAVPLCNLRELPREQLDWAIAELIPHINGANYAKAIAERSEVHVAIVLKALRCLATRGLVAIVPPFQFHSLYLVTRMLTSFTPASHLWCPCENLLRIAADTVTIIPSLRRGRAASRRSETAARVRDLHTLWAAGTVKRECAL
jgi:hypothetical protein